MADDERPYLPDPIQIDQHQTITWEIDNFPTKLSVIREGLREWVDHPVFDAYPPDTEVSWAVSKEEGRVDMTLTFRVFSNTDAHLNAALLDGDDARYQELLNRDR